MKTRIGIIGSGVVGTAVGVILNARGYEITGVYDQRTESTQKLVERIGCPAHLDPCQVARAADILFITTNDSAITAVAEALAQGEAFRPGQTVIHMSGAETTAILGRAREFGARVLSVHPLQSFADLEMAVLNLPGSVFSIEGDQEAAATGRELVEALGGEYFFIAGEVKPLYHAGACVASNYLVTLLDLGIKLLAAAGIPAERGSQALLPLVYGTLKNIERLGIPTALTGPIARGDLATIEKHLDRIQELRPELLPIYAVLGLYTAPLAESKGTIDPDTRGEIEEILGRHLGPGPGAL